MTNSYENELEYSFDDEEYKVPFYPIFKSFAWKQIVFSR